MIAETIFLDDIKSDLAVLETGRQSYYTVLCTTGGHHETWQGAVQKYQFFITAVFFFSLWISPWLNWNVLHVFPFHKYFFSSLILPLPSVFSKYYLKSKLHNCLWLQLWMCAPATPTVVEGIHWTFIFTANCRCRSLFVIWSSISHQWFQSLCAIMEYMLPGYEKTRLKPTLLV